MVHKACCCAGCCCYKIIDTDGNRDEYTVHQIEGLSKFDCLCPDDPECPDPEKCRCGIDPNTDQPFEGMVGIPIWTMHRNQPCSDETCEVGCCCYKDEETGCWNHRDTDSGLVGYYYPEERKIGGCYGHPSKGVPPYFHTWGRTCEGLDREAIEEWGEEECLENCEGWDVPEGEYGQSLGVPRSACGPACGKSADVFWWNEGLYRDDPYRTRPVPFGASTTAGPCCNFDNEECTISPSRWECEDPICSTIYEGGGYFGTEGDVCDEFGCKKGLAIAVINCNAALGGEYDLSINFPDQNRTISIGTNANSRDARDCELNLPQYAADLFTYDEAFLRETLDQICGPIDMLTVTFQEELNDIPVATPIYLLGDATVQRGSYGIAYMWWPFDSIDDELLGMDYNSFINDITCCGGGGEFSTGFFIDPSPILEGECGGEAVAVPIGACCNPNVIDGNECEECTDDVTEGECFDIGGNWNEGERCSNDPNPCNCTYHPCCYGQDCLPPCEDPTCDGEIGTPGGPTTCELLTAEQCADKQGSWLTDYSSCQEAANAGNYDCCGGHASYEGVCCWVITTNCSCGQTLVEVESLEVSFDGCQGHNSPSCQERTLELKEQYPDSSIVGDFYRCESGGYCDQFGGEPTEPDSYVGCLCGGEPEGGLPEGCPPRSCNDDTTCCKSCPDDEYGQCCPEGHCCSFPGHTTFCSNTPCVELGCDDGFNNPDNPECTSDEDCDSIVGDPCCCNGCCTGRSTGICCPYGDDIYDPCDPDDQGLLFIPPRECEGEFLCPPCCEDGDPNQDCEACFYGPMCDPACNEENSNYTIIPADGGDSLDRPCCFYQPPAGYTEVCLTIKPSVCVQMGGIVDYDLFECTDMGACSGIDNT